MATGIIAVGAAQQDLDLVANTLFVIALVAFVVLAALTVARLVRYPRPLISDLTHHRTGFSFLTIVAALNVLGSGAAVIHQWWTFAWVAWIAGVVCWLLLLYPPLLGGHPRRAQARARRRHQRHLVPPHRLHRVRRRARRPPPRPRERTEPTARAHRPRRVHPRPRALPHRHDDALPALDLLPARARRAATPVVDRRGRRRHHRPRRLQPARRPGRPPRASTGSLRSSKAS